MTDDPRVANCSTFANVIIGEVKTGPCTLNGPWTRPEDQNMHRAVRAIGCLPETAVDHACQTLYANGIWQNETTTIRLFALGEAYSENLIIPREQQIIWSDIIRFIIQRFSTYRRQKSSTPQWTKDGLKLKNLCCRTSAAEVEIRKAFRLRTDGPSLGGE